MKRAGPWAAAVLLCCLLAGPARAAETEVSGAAAYFSESGAALTATLGRFWSLPGIDLGPRLGFAYLTNPNSAGIPADLVARIGLPGFYIEGQAGLWFIFTRGTTVRFHATGGAGISLGLVRIGAEAGYLTSGALIGGRVSFGF
jgi:hypothetical protein